MIRTYRELRTFETFLERYEYLRLGAMVGESTFGFDRYINQSFYRSKKWKDVRNRVIIRDDGCDLGIEDRKIFDKIVIHHITPITFDQIENEDPALFDMDNLICTSHATHQAIHFGDASLLPPVPIERFPGDTVLW